MTESLGCALPAARPQLTHPAGCLVRRRVSGALGIRQNQVYNVKDCLPRGRGFSRAARPAASKPPLCPPSTGGRRRSPLDHPAAALCHRVHPRAPKTRSETLSCHTRRYKATSRTIQMVKHLAEETQYFVFSSLSSQSLTAGRAVLYLIDTTSSSDLAKRIIKSEITFKEIKCLKIAAGRQTLGIILKSSEVSPLLSRTGYASQHYCTWEDKSAFRQQFNATNYQSDPPSPPLLLENWLAFTTAGCGPGYIQLSVWADMEDNRVLAFKSDISSYILSYICHTSFPVLSERVTL